jgi:hypothetical protein
MMVNIVPPHTQLELALEHRERYLKILNLTLSSTLNVPESEYLNGNLEVLAKVNQPFQEIHVQL